MLNKVQDEMCLVVVEQRKEFGEWSPYSVQPVCHGQENTPLGKVFMQQFMQSPWLLRKELSLGILPGED